MFFYPTALAEPGLHQFGKQLFLKSAESRFPKTAETDFSDFCRNKITIYICGLERGVSMKSSTLVPMGKWPGLVNSMRSSKMATLRDSSSLQADPCVLVFPCGRSAHTETGWFAGKGLKTIVYMPEKQEPELMYKLFDGVVSSLNELIESLKR